VNRFRTVTEGFCGAQHQIGNRCALQKTRRIPYAAFDEKVDEKSSTFFLVYNIIVYNIMRYFPFFVEKSIFRCYNVLTVDKEGR